MSEINRQLANLQELTQVYPVDPDDGARRAARNLVHVLIAPDPEYSRYTVTKVWCRYSVSGQEISFVRNTCNESFDKALNWAKTFAGAHGIENVIATDLTAAG